MCPQTRTTPSFLEKNYRHARIALSVDYRVRIMNEMDTVCFAVIL